MRIPSPQRTVARLAACQVLLLTNAVLMVAVNALAGFALAPSRRLATIPVVTYVLGAATSTLPASFFMKRHGRRAGFLLGASLGVAGGAVGALASRRTASRCCSPAPFCPVSTTPSASIIASPPPMRRRPPGGAEQSR